MKTLTQKPSRNNARWAAAAFSLLVLGPQSPPLAPPAAAQQSTPSAATLMQQGAAAEAAGQWKSAGQAYTQASNAYTAAGQSQEAKAAALKALEMSSKEINDFIAAQSPAAPAATPAPAPTPDEAPLPPLPVTAAPESGNAPLPLAKSAIVHTNKYGGLAVASAAGAPIDGVKISKFDINVQSPSLAVGPDGVIHAVFWEMHGTSQETGIYYRSSADGGKSWTPAKNLSEVVPDTPVGRCQVVVDGTGRVYVIWRSAAGEYNPANITPHTSGPYENLVYRVLSGGQWNAQPIPIHPLATYTNQLIGSASDFASVDPAGTVHVAWVEDPSDIHPDGTQTDLGLSQVMEATLDGTTPSAPRQVYEAPVTHNGPYSASEDLDLINGYFDASKQAHFVAVVVPPHGTESHFKVIENGGQTPGVDLPDNDALYWTFPPTLLRDAQGRQHIITLYPAGDAPDIRDYTVGSDTEPKIIRAVKGTAGSLDGFEAFSSPGGEMVALMEMNDTGKKTDSELYVSTSNGGAWSAPVNVTNNTGRFAFHATQTGLHSSTVTESWGYPKACAATFDKSGHLLLLYVRNTASLFGVNAGSVELAGGETATPNLMFLRF